MGLNAVDLGLLRLSRQSDIEDEVIPQAEKTQESALLRYIFCLQTTKARINGELTGNNQKRIGYLLLCYSCRPTIQPMPINKFNMNI